MTQDTGLRVYILISDFFLFFFACKRYYADIFMTRHLIVMLRLDDTFSKGKDIECLLNSF